MAAPAPLPYRREAPLVAAAFDNTTAASINATVQARVTATIGAAAAKPTPAPGLGDTVSKGNWAYTVTTVTRPGKSITTGNPFARLDTFGTSV
jgi:hypothetical protein